MKALNWSEIHSAADGKTEYIDHVQIKTKDRVTIPLSEEAKNGCLKGLRVWITSSTNLQ